jgi:hypothetical protein
LGERLRYQIECDRSELEIDLATFQTSSKNNEIRVTIGGILLLAMKLFSGDSGAIALTFHQLVTTLDRILMIIASLRVLRLKDRFGRLPADDSG